MPSHACQTKARPAAAFLAQPCLPCFGPLYRGPSLIDYGEYLRQFDQLCVAVAPRVEFTKRLRENLLAEIGITQGVNG